MDHKGHILIVNYDFPPNRGIGGRRWAKFARQLAIEGYRVDVIKADALAGADDSAWSADAIHPNIHITSLPRKYPHGFSHPGNDILSKLIYRFHKWNLERKVSGTIYDLSIGWESVLIPVLKKTIFDHKITNLIATGAPWQMLYDISKVKNENPDLNLIIDFRDPWLTATNYGMSALSPKRRKAEEIKQTYVLDHANSVTTPASHITEELRQWAEEHCKHQARFELLSHFYDPTDFEELKHHTPRKNDIIKFVYGGDLYFGMEEQLLDLKNQIVELKIKRPELYARLDIQIYTSTANDTFKEVDKVSIKPPIGKKLMIELASADFCLVMLPYNKRNDLTTKFVEYLPYRKPIVVISPEGEATKFVQRNGIGIKFNHSENSLEHIMDRYIQGKFEFNVEFDISAYSLPSVTKKLISLFH